ncbi:MAG: transporter [Candidatus Magasanikbacteria bacterium RIFOXYC2_FULL_42_28]|uniref:Probable queuosine precursor transporter n=1 Tax=Candidatus Magasanikbacteria bacterium RIFOXYC2_FULL_42_28 TaxID=1798704 RepID=A0A1F6NWU9_9BACT|nr:MAG: transporter [Candidatus Magasanikbacteria bacterium RIFOXYC2_FULL_42_28]
MSNSKFYQLISALFVTCLIISNIIAVKIGAFGSYFLPVAVILFPITYIIGDILTEVYGYAAARRAIWTGFACNLLAVVAIYISIKIPSAPFFANQTAFEQILGFTPRLLVASFSAYLVGQFVNSMLLSKMKIKTQGKHLWARTIGSTVVGEGLDSLIFISLAFWGVMPVGVLGGLILTQWIFKVLFETVSTPFTYYFVSLLKKKEGVDVYDTETKFNPLAL